MMDKVLIESLLEGYKLTELREEAFSLTNRYQIKDVNSGDAIDTDLKAKIYAVIRMPATVKVSLEVFKRVFEIYNPSIDSVLDVGSGLGAMIDALKRYKEVDNIDALEINEHMINVSKLINERDINYINKDITIDNITPHDLVMSSYVLNEIGTRHRKEVMRKMFDATNKLLVIIEPGTPEGSQVIKEVRDYALSHNGYIVAPCTHHNKCPMYNDWCHFLTRVERSRLHKLLKEGNAPFEDEKYSYIAISKEPIEISGNRILRHPHIYKGMVEVEICNKEGIKKEQIRKNHPDYKVIKKLDSNDKY